MCQNTTIRIYGARIKRYCVLWSKHIAVRVVLSYNFPLVRDKPPQGARICVTGLLRATNALFLGLELRLQRSLLDSQASRFGFVFFIKIQITRLTATLLLSYFCLCDNSLGSYEARLCVIERMRCVLKYDRQHHRRWYTTHLYIWNYIYHISVSHERTICIVSCWGKVARWITKFQRIQVCQ